MFRSFWRLSWKTCKLCRSIANFLFDWMNALSEVIISKVVFFSIRSRVVIYMILSFATVCLKIFMKHIGRFVFHENIQMWKKQINWCNDIFIETFLIFNSKKNHRNINRFFTKIYNLKMLASFLQSEVTRNTSQILFNVIVRVLFNAKNP